MTLLIYIKFAIIAMLVSLTGCINLDGGSGGEPGKKTGDLEPQVVSKVESYPDFRLPAKVFLCGESLDLTKRSVYERLEYEFLLAANHPGQVALWQRRAEIYFPEAEKALKAAGLPDDLKYLAVAESDLRPGVSSPAGASGLWQFMPGTARQFGLTVTANVDQRQLPEPLLGAATTYLNALNGKFGSWALAMAAYNCGDGRLGKAISSQGTRDYYQLDLPRETERYVYRIAAIKIILENPSAYGFSSSHPPQYKPAQYAEITVNFEKTQSWSQVASKLGCDYKTLRSLNPHIYQASLSGKQTLRVPPGFENKLAQ